MGDLFSFFPFADGHGWFLFLALVMLYVINVQKYNLFVCLAVLNFIGCIPWNGIIVSFGKFIFNFERS